jgi:hypothetical protein
MTKMSYAGGDRVTIGGGIVITLVTRKGRNGTRWTWVTETEGGELYWPTPADAIAAAAKTMHTPPCRHGETAWCSACHDEE